MMSELFIQIIAGLAVAAIGALTTWLLSPTFRAWFSNNRRNVRNVFIIALLSQIPFIAYLVFSHGLPSTSSTTKLKIDPAWEKIISDDFSNISSENYWFTGIQDLSSGKVNSSFESGKLRIELDDCQSDHSTLYYSKLLKPGYLDDAYMAVEGKAVKGSDNREYGLYFRRADNSFYFFFVQDAKNLFSLSYYDVENWVYILPPTKTDIINKNGNNRIGVFFKDNSIRLYLNDSLVGEVTDARLFGGTLGIGASYECPQGSVYEFDNFDLYKP